MAFCITFGTQEFTSNLQGYETVTAQCRNCGNWSARCITRWPWFTVCFIPVLPLATHKYKELACPICRFNQDLRDRPDVMNQQGGGAVQGQGQGPGPGYNSHQYGQGQPQGWNGQGQGQQQQHKPQYA